jgi:hypothetical protein
MTVSFWAAARLKTFAAFVLPDLAGSVVVHDQYQNYDAFPRACARGLDAVPASLAGRWSTRSGTASSSAYPRSGAHAPKTSLAGDTG